MKDPPMPNLRVMGRFFRTSSRMPGREPQKEEKEPEKSKKKSLQDACKDLKKAAVERQQEKEREVAKVVHDAEFEALMAQMYGPQIDPRGPLLEYEGKRIPKSVFEDILIRTFKEKANRLPLAWESEKDYLAHCLKERWIEMDDVGVTILAQESADTKAA
jgi:hypothetical protein